MCGRYATFLPAEAIARIFGTTNPPPNLAPSWNIAPSQNAPVVRRHPESGARHLDLLQWGLLPHWTRDPAKARRPINARAETVATTGMFRDAFARRRCLVPVDAFYEWKPVANGKQPYAIVRADGGPLAFAGLWEGFRSTSGEVTRSFAIITTRANAEMAAIHDRMPVILDPADWPLWLGEEAGDPAATLHPLADGALRLWPVSRAVNTPRNNGPTLLEPVTGQDEPA
jgi:putative SOS response-associated peptidase YedK